jgi:chaperonin GroES
MNKVISKFEIMTNIKPLGRNVLVQPLEEKEKLTSGIVLPDSEKENSPQEGIVVALGDSKEIDSEIKKGVIVVFRQFSGDKVISDDIEYIVLDAKKDVVAIIKEK